MAVFRQKKVGFKPVSVRAQLGIEKLPSLSEVRAKENALQKINQMTFATNGRKPLFKRIVEEKVSAFRESLPENALPYFDEMLIEIRKNGSAAIGDISSNVIRRLKQRNPSGIFMPTKVDSLINAAKKQGVILVQ